MKKTFFIFTAMGMLLLSSCDNKPKAESSTTQSQDTQSSSQDGSKGAVSGENPASSVKAEEGGIGFEKVAANMGFVTASGKNYASPNAKKGGTFRYSLQDYPNVLRPYGPDSSTVDVRAVTDPLYLQKLIGFNFETNQWERGLADYWKFENNDTRLTLRLNPNVTFSDGTYLTANDIIATHEFLLSDELGDPMTKEYEKRYKMTKLSDYLLQIDLEGEYEFNVWYNLPSSIFSENYLSKVDPKTYTEKYAHDTMPGLGAYILNKDRSKDQEIIVLERNPNWWGNSYEELKNTYNFDNIEIKIIREEKIETESLKKGDIDFLLLTTKAPEWYGDFLKENATLDEIKRNLIVKRVIFNGNPKSRSFFIFNTRIKPFDNIKLRRAISMAFNKDIAIEKVDHNDTAKYYSQTPMSSWVSPKLEEFPYNPDEASKLLDEAGYNIVDEDGIRKNEAGERLEFEISLYKQDRNERIHTLLQEDLKKVGIKLNLVITDFPNIIKKLDDRDFNMIRIGLTGPMYPEYQTEILGSLADEKSSNNMGGFKDARVDELIGMYLKERDVKKQHEYSDEIDEIVAKSHTYMHLWTFPFTVRYVMWNKFACSTPYQSGQYDIDDSVRYCYIDTDKDLQLQKARTDQSIVMDEGQLVSDPFHFQPKDYTIKQY